MSATIDPALLRKRRTVEAAAFVARGFGLLCTIVFLAGALGAIGHRPPPMMLISCGLGVVLMMIGNGLAAYNWRHPDGRHYEPLSAIQVAIDTATVTAIVVWAQGYNGQTAWPLLIIAIVVGAYRHRLAGSTVVWAITSLAFGLAMRVAPQPALRANELFTATFVGLIVAILCGIQGEAFLRQVKELERARRALHHQANHDTLTGLANREQMIAYAQAQHGRAIAVLVIDLDGFKQINDTLGHAAGDRLLQEVARRLSGGLRAGDLACRIGGDEFVVLMPGAGREVATDLAGRLRAAIRRPVDLDGTPAEVGASIGVAARAAGEPIDTEVLARLADEAMYREKAATR